MADDTLKLNSEFKYTSDYDDVFEHIIETDTIVVPPEHADSESHKKCIEWPNMREAIKYKLNENVAKFIDSEDEYRKSNPKPPDHPPMEKPSPNGGLKLAPFPERLEKPNVAGALDVPKVFLTRKEANKELVTIFEELDEFEDGAPFTIQRLSQLILHPTSHYKTVGKYLRAVFRVILVTASHPSFPPLPQSSQIGPMHRIVTVLGREDSLSLDGSAPPTPSFSPIPFLHSDARRSQSKSPPPSPLALGPSATGAGAEKVVVPDDQVPGLGLVDELDDPNPEHMSDKPTALSATTTSKPESTKPTGKGMFGGSLGERFVKGGEMEPEGPGKSSSAGVEGKKVKNGGGEEEKMAIDEAKHASDAGEKDVKMSEGTTKKRK